MSGIAVQPERRARVLNRTVGVQEQRRDGADLGPKRFLEQPLDPVLASRISVSLLRNTTTSALEARDGRVVQRSEVERARIPEDTDSAGAARVPAKA